MTTCKCDHCGAEVPVNTLSKVAIAVASGKPQTREEAYFGGKSEAFEFCTECALSLLIGLKARKTHIEKYGKVVRM